MRGDGLGEYGGLFINWRMLLVGGVKFKKDFLMFIDDYIWKQVWQFYVEVVLGDIKFFLFLVSIFYFFCFLLYFVNMKVDYCF